MLRRPGAERCEEGKEPPPGDASGQGEGERASAGDDGDRRVGEKRNVNAMVTSPRNILTGSAGTGALMVVHAALSVATAMFFARLMGPEGYGVYSFGLAVATLLTIPAKNGLSGLIVREVARAFGAQDWPRLRGVMRWASAVTIAYSTALGGAVASACLLLAPDVPMAQATALSMLLVPVWSLLGNWSGGVRGLARPVLGLAADSAVRPVLHLGLVAGAAYGLGVALTPAIAMQTQVAATAVAAILLMAAFRLLLPVPVKAIRTQSIAWREWTRAALPFAAIGGLQVANRQIDLVFLGLLTDEAQVGLYRVAIQGSMLITFGTQAVNTVVSPYFARHRPGSAPSQLWVLMRTSVIVSLAVALPGVLAFALFGGAVVVLVFGESFSDAASPLVILSIANAVAALNGAIVPLLNMTGNEKGTLRILCVGLITAAVLNLILIPLFTAVGAATAAVISTVIWSHMLRRAARRQLGVDPIKTLFARTHRDR